MFGSENLSDTNLNPTSTNLQAKPLLLLVDDDPLIIDSLSLVLQKKFNLLTADSRKQTDTLLHSLSEFPVIALIDLGLPPRPHSPDEGFALINDLIGLNRHIKILVLSGQDEQINIQRALAIGATDFIPKPCDVGLLNSRLDYQLMMLEAELAEIDDKKHEIILGESPAIKTLKSLIGQFADSPFPVLIEGESGSGKELVAESLHYHSARSRAPFLTINCAAFTSDLLEAQLFGHSKGAYTGAVSDKRGFFEEAGEGTLFLDEIGELPRDLQSKLLRVLENGEFYRVGETNIRVSRVRIIAATNRDLKDAVRSNRFRQDLYHRLSVLTINVPPLRERSEDCLYLLRHFQELYTVPAGPFELTAESVKLLKQYSFPGNVRELRNIVIRLGAKYPGMKITPDKLEPEFESLMRKAEGAADIDTDLELEMEMRAGNFNLDETIERYEKQYIQTALKLSGDNLTKAAKLLGINRTTLYSRIQRYSMEGTS